MNKFKLKDWVFFYTFRMKNILFNRRWFTMTKKRYIIKTAKAYLTLDIKDYLERKGILERTIMLHYLDRSPLIPPTGEFLTVPLNLVSLMKLKFDLGVIKSKWPGKLKILEENRA